jgi:hypothetical protein
MALWPFLGNANFWHWSTRNLRISSINLRISDKNLSIYSLDFQYLFPGF